MKSRPRGKTALLHFSLQLKAKHETRSCSVRVGFFSGRGFCGAGRRFRSKDRCEMPVRFVLHERPSEGCACRSGRHWQGQLQGAPRLVQVRSASANPR